MDTINYHQLYKQLQTIQTQITRLQTVCNANMGRSVYSTIDANSISTTSLTLDGKDLSETITELEERISALETISSVVTVS